MELSSLSNIIKGAGVAGCGGAGFPSYGKLSDKADTIILNCAECEPLFKVHRQVLTKYAFEILSALDIISDATGAKEFIVAVKGEYKEAVEAVKSFLPQFKKGKISLLPEIYPAGDEVITIYEATARVVPAGNIPISVGVIVFNVETALNIYKAVKGGEAVTHKFVTVAGEVKNPQTFFVPIGTSFSHLIKLCGGAKRADAVILSGGPMTGMLASGHDTVTKTTNGILLLPEDNPVIIKRKTKNSVSVLRAKSTCCQCRMCTDLCPRNLLGQPVKPHEFMRAAANGDYKDAQALADNMYCVSCGVCEMYACSQGLSPRSLISEFKNKMRQNGVKIVPDSKKREVKSEREYRKVPMSRLKEKLGLTEYDVAAPLSEMSEKEKRIKIMLRQHIGAPAVPAVSVKQKVLAGEMLAAAKEGALSLPVHSPTSGEVVEVNDSFILINCD